MDYRVKYALNKGIRLGCGIRSEVFHLDDNWVVKKMHDECDGFWAIVNITPACREKLCMPRIDDLRSNKEEGIIVIEKLVRMDYSLWEGTDEVHNRMNDLHLRNSHRTRIFNIDDYLSKNHPLYDITLAAFHSWKVMKRLGYGITLDINPSNVMVRPSDRKLILSDPFGYIDI